MFLGLHTKLWGSHAVLRILGLRTLVLRLPFSEPAGSENALGTPYKPFEPCPRARSQCPFKS